jgi:hypothetical protein
LIDSNTNCTDITGQSKGGMIVNVTLYADNKIKKIIGSSKCLGSDWFYSNQDSKVLRFENSFGIRGEKVTMNFVIPLSSSENTPSQHADIDLPDTR